ncbi:unnamed protein product [Oikopleura dioica]|uniref:Uncharacterized protein n=1 Tax=Oikopleura dioica TaxID=34765 RepID=E4WSU7_OIKDI|nr:unnamed protein product [Oikopleura dioica]
MSSFLKGVKAKSLDQSTNEKISLNSPIDDFVIACHKGYMRDVDKYLKSPKYSPNQTDFFGWTGLHAACAGCHLHLWAVKIKIEIDL